MNAQAGRRHGLLISAQQLPGSRRHVPTVSARLAACLGHKQWNPHVHIQTALLVPWPSRSSTASSETLSNRIPSSWTTDNCCCYTFSGDLRRRQSVRVRAYPCADVFSTPLAWVPKRVLNLFRSLQTGRISCLAMGVYTPKPIL